MANLGYSFLLVLTAFIWGTAFVAQVSGNVLGPFVFSCVRCFIASAFLVIVFKVFDKIKTNSKIPKTKEQKILLLKSGLVCGSILAVAMNLQQLGMYLGTSAGKSGFLTACYIILVPVVSLFLGKKNSLKTWICVAITLVGLYNLCIKDGFNFEFSDIISLLCALAFSFHILAVDKFVSKVDPVRLSCVQFLVVGILTLVPMFAVDLKFSFLEFKNVMTLLISPKPLISLLYASLFSSGIAYTLQIVAQDKIKPTVASLLMSLESVFAVLAGFVILNEVLTTKEFFGCVLMMFAIAASQIKNK